MAKYVAAVDQGTTSTRCMIFDHSGRVVSVSQKEHEQIFPQPGWVEHNPEEIWTSVRQAVLELFEMTGITSQQILAIGITNQRETTVLWERADGRPVANAIVWQCRRSASVCEKLRSQGLEEMYRQRTGLVLDPYFSGTKMTWLMEERPEIAKAVRAGKAVFGTIDTYLLSKLTAADSYVTEASNASRTLANHFRF